MAVTLPEGSLETRLSRYLEGFNNRHGIEDSSVEGNLVLVVVKPEDLPAVLTTARDALGILHLSFITVVDRQGSFELTYELLDLRGAQVRVKTTIEGDEPVIGSVTGHLPDGQLARAGGLRHVRGRLQGASRPQAVVHVAGPLRPSPAAQELRDLTRRTFEGLR
jgi:NADH-quinone oxidoreductase subunit C